MRTAQPTQADWCAENPPPNHRTRSSSSAQGTATKIDLPQAIKRTAVTQISYLTIMESD